MSILAIVLIAVLLVVAVGYCTFCSIQSENTQNLPKEIADELDPYNKTPKMSTELR